MKEYTGRYYKKVTFQPYKTMDLHRFLAMKALGKPLPAKVEVHHMERKKDGGVIVICEDAAYHRILHIRQKAHETTGDVLKRKCTFCKEWDSLENLAKFARLGEHYYHKNCRKQHRHNYYLKTHK
jgi:hypothetical protein